MSKYEIKLKPTFTNTRRRRAGLELTRGISQTVELSKEQLEELKADEQIVVTAVKEASKKDDSAKKPAKKTTTKKAE